MWLYDFLIFYNSGKAIFSGVSPYEIDGFISPIFLAIFFSPFSILPVEVSYSLFLITNLLLAWKFLKKRIIWGVLFFPFLFSLFVGQIDFLIAGIVFLGSPWTIALALVKPQLAFVVIPWMIIEFSKKDWLKAGTSTSIFLFISFIIQPSWFKEWLSLQSNFGIYTSHASNIFWLIPNTYLELKKNLTLIFMLLIFPLGFILKNRRDSWTILHLFAPLTNIYSPTVLIEWISPIEVMLSWIAVILVGGNIHTGMPFFLVGGSIIFRGFFKKARSDDKQIHLEDYFKTFFVEFVKNVLRIVR